MNDEPPGHVIITPETLAELQDWAASRESGIIHPLTQEILDAITEIGKKRASYG